MSVKSRIGELNARLATKLTARGVTASEDETTTALINKVDDIPEGGGIDWSQWTDWQYFSCNNNRNELVAKLKYSDTANGTNFNNMFSSCSALTTIPQLDTSKGNSFNNMFYYCSNLTTIPQLDTSSGTNFSSMFRNCNNLTTIPQLDTSKGKTFNNMFDTCLHLTTIPQLDTSSGTNFSSMFSYCRALTSISLLNMSSMTSIAWSSMFQNCTALENVTFEGTIPVRGNMTVFSSCPNLTVESLMSFINALTNMSSSSTYTITIGSTNLAKLTEEQIQIATDKRITLQ